MIQYSAPLRSKFRRYVLLDAPLSRGMTVGAEASLKRSREILGALQIAVAVHSAVGDRQQFRHRVVTDRHRIALVAAALEKIRGWDLLAQRLRPPQPVQAGRGD